MSYKDVMGERLKDYYENRNRFYLTRRTPVMIRIDGRAFHTFTKKFQKPFDKALMKTMQDTMLYLCENIQGCVFGYTQSDEITLILQDYAKLDTDAWFDYNVQKMCSISSSMATMQFNRMFEKNVQNMYPDLVDVLYKPSIEKGAMFDSRCFNLPKEEVTNFVYWRQTDASKNSVQMVAREYFSHRELDKKNTSEQQDMLITRYGVNWNDYTTSCKRGTACKKIDGKWVVDYEMPILKGENRLYVEETFNFTPDIVVKQEE